MDNNSRYATLDIPGAMGYKEIVEKLSETDKKITAARARLILMASLEKIARHVGRKRGKPLSREAAKQIVQDPDFQNTIAPLIQSAYRA
jgi:hypothetical protein